MIAPGKIADFALLESLEEMQPVMVFKSGSCVYEKGVLEEEQAEIQAGKLTEKQVEKVFSVGDFPGAFLSFGPLPVGCKEDFQIKVENRSAVFAEVNVIKYRILALPQHLLHGDYLLKTDISAGRKQDCPWQ